MDTNVRLPEWLIKSLGILLAVFLLLLVIDKGYGVSKNFKSQKPENTISISAEGKVSAVPDLAIVNLGVIAQAETAAAAQDQSTQKVNRIIEYLKKQGIVSEDITTSQFSIYPQYNYQEGGSKIVGYQSNQTVTVKVRGVDKSKEKLGKILAGATENGANEVTGVFFSFDDPDNLKQEARKKAVSKAKEKATELAREAGLKLGRVISIAENPSGGVPIPLLERGSGGGGFDQAKVLPPTVEPGSQDITQIVTVVFEVK